MQDPLRELEHLGKLAAADPLKRFGKLYRVVCHMEVLTQAGERVRQNTGGRGCIGKKGAPYAASFRGVTNVWDVSRSWTTVDR